MNKSNLFSDILKPAFVLAAVSLIVSAALVTGYNFTKKPEGFVDPAVTAEASDLLGEEAQPLETDLSRFSEYNVEAVFNAQSGASAVYLWTKGYGGDIRMLVAVDPDGKIRGVRIVEMMETAGLGDRTKNPEFTDQYIGKSGEIRIGSGDNSIDAVSGATISSKAVTLGVNNALKVFETVKTEVADNA